MEIEYQNKYVVSWCLDRDGPRICLRAVTRESEIRKIEVISDNFMLEFEDEEARAFLNILSQLVAERTIVAQVPQYPEPKEAIIEEEIPVSSIVTHPENLPVITGQMVTEATPEVKEAVSFTAAPLVKESVSFEAVPRVEEPVAFDTAPKVEESVSFEAVPRVEEPVPSDHLDSSEIIRVLKHSERTFSESIASSPDDVSIEDQLSITPKPERPSIAPKKLEIHPIRESTDVLQTEIETASFFQKSESKSPLEMLLEDEGKKEEIEDKSTQVPEMDVLEEPKLSQKPSIAFTPDDLQTEAFFSKFDTKSSLDLLKKPEAEPELKIDHSVKLAPTPTIIKKEGYVTEVERRAAIEKERAERRKRLWELTRGF